jgi:GNAT superfamily N-acetyltransferase
MLFRESARAAGNDASFQNFEQELESLPGIYKPPGGTLLLCLEHEVPVGCVALKKWDKFTCEMKRLYVRELSRDKGIGESLVRAAIICAEEAGYVRINVDTIPSMHAAQKLLSRLGFTDIPPYRYNPVVGARFLSRPLR